MWVKIAIFARYTGPPALICRNRFDPDAHSAGQDRRSGPICIPTGDRGNEVGGCCISSKKKAVGCHPYGREARAALRVRVKLSFAVRIHED